MKLHLDHTPPKSSFEISHRDKLMLVGSCFSENMGARLKALRFNSMSNSCGILFNPLSIHTTLTNWIQENETHGNYIVERSGEYFCYLNHSSVKGSSKEELDEKIRAINQKALEFLKSCDVLMITFGSAFYYWHKELNTAVANCHKQSQNLFDKKLLTVKETGDRFHELIAQLKNVNPEIKILFTVSPVKYLRDGIIENNISKSTLLLSIHELIKRNRESCFYFPAYELINDDLRDYRFYKEDMAHPNEQAINYVWEKFSDCYFDERTKELNRLIQKLNSALAHKQLHQNKSEQEKFEGYISQLKSEITEAGITVD